jgi:hypothetical protein
MIDVSSFIIERDRLRRYCFQQTTAAIVIRDVCRGDVKEPRNNLVSRLAEWLQFLLTVDARRFADPDDTCDDFGPTIFALPTIDAKRDVATILSASNGYEAIVVDYRFAEAVLPMFAPHLACDKRNAIKTWDRVLRKQRRMCAIVTLDDTIDDIAVQCDGGRLLRRSTGETFDLACRFWLQAYHEIASQRCMRREAWKQRDFRTKGNA